MVPDTILPPDSENGNWRYTLGEKGVRYTFLIPFPP